MIKSIATYAGGSEFYEGIPARDLTPADWQQLTAVQKLTVINGGLYTVNIPEKKAAAKRPEKIAPKQQEDK